MPRWEVQERRPCPTMCPDIISKNFMSKRTSQSWFDVKFLSNKLAKPYETGIFCTRKQFVASRLFLKPELVVSFPCMHDGIQQTLYDLHIALSQFCVFFAQQKNIDHIIKSDSRIEISGGIFERSIVTHIKNVEYLFEPIWARFLYRSVWKIVRNIRVKHFATRETPEKD